MDYCDKCDSLLDDDGNCFECEYLDNCSFDAVNKPFHYNQGGIECIDYIKQVLGLDGFIAYCHGNMIKYQHRYRYKQNPVEDMKKAEWYLKKMNEALQEKHR